MAQLIVDIANCEYGVRYFLAQELTVTLTHTVRRLSYCALSHPKFARNIRGRRAIRLIRERLL
jgi:hypothetical protein